MLNKAGKRRIGRLFNPIQSIPISTRTAERKLMDWPAIRASTKAIDTIQKNDTSGDREDPFDEIGAKWGKKGAAFPTYRKRRRRTISLL